MKPHPPGDKSKRQPKRNESLLDTNFQIQNIQRVADYLSGLTGNRIDFQEVLNSGIDAIRKSIVGLQRCIATMRIISIKRAVSRVSVGRPWPEPMLGPLQ